MTSPPDHAEACVTPEHACSQCKEYEGCASNDFWEEWAHLDGRLLMGEMEWSAGAELHWCSVECMVRWVTENYYTASGRPPGRWVKVEDDDDE